MQRFSLREREWEVGWMEVVDAKLLQQKLWTEGRMEEVRCLLFELGANLKTCKQQLDKVVVDLRLAKDFKANVNSSDKDQKLMRGECGERAGVPETNMKEKEERKAEMSNMMEKIAKERQEVELQRKILEEEQQARQREEERRQQQLKEDSIRIEAERKKVEEEWKKLEKRELACHKQLDGLKLEQESEARKREDENKRLGDEWRKIEAERKTIEADRRELEMRQRDLDAAWRHHDTEMRVVKEQQETLKLEKAKTMRELEHERELFRVQKMKTEERWVIEKGQLSSLKEQIEERENRMQKREAQMKERESSQERKLADEWKKIKEEKSHMLDQQKTCLAEEWKKIEEEKVRSKERLQEKERRLSEKLALRKERYESRSQEIDKQWLKMEKERRAIELHTHETQLQQERLERSRLRVESEWGEVEAERERLCTRERRLRKLVVLRQGEDAANRHELMEEKKRQLEREKRCLLQKKRPVRPPPDYNIFSSSDSDEDDFAVFTMNTNTRFHISPEPQQGATQLSSNWPKEADDGSPWDTGENVSRPVAQKKETKCISPSGKSSAEEMEASTSCVAEAAVEKKKKAVKKKRVGKELIDDQIKQEFETFKEELRTKRVRGASRNILMPSGTAYVENQEPERKKSQKKRTANNELIDDQIKQEFETFKEELRTKRVRGASNKILMPPETAYVENHEPERKRSQKKRTAKKELIEDELIHPELDQTNNLMQPVTEQAIEENQELAKKKKIQKKKMVRQTQHEFDRINQEPEQTTSLMQPVMKNTTVEKQKRKKKTEKMQIANKVPTYDDRINHDLDLLRRELSVHLEDQNKTANTETNKEEEEGVDALIAKEMELMEQENPKKKDKKKKSKGSTLCRQS